MKKRVRYNRADLKSAINAALRLQSSQVLYIFGSYYGYIIEHRKPPVGQSYLAVHPDGTIERGTA